jgi:hypothetical protein
MRLQTTIKTRSLRSDGSSCDDTGCMWELKPRQRRRSEGVDQELVASRCWYATARKPERPSRGDCAVATVSRLGPAL